MRHVPRVSPYVAFTVMRPHHLSRDQASSLTTVVLSVSCIGGDCKARSSPSEPMVRACSSLLSAPVQEGTTVEMMYDLLALDVLDFIGAK